jgi:histidinol dehydrogenase
VAFGYQTIQPCDLVVGPGNAYVNEAKKQLQGKIKIDGLAGPSELLAICDNQQPIDWLALDALAQAEHDPNACSLIVSDSRDWLTQLQQHLKADRARQNLLKNQQIQLIYAKDKAALIAFSDAFAPEHLVLCHHDIQPDELNHYGSLFIGANSAVALGDYITGPNHTLPTLANARQNGGLNVHTFLRVQTRQTISNIGRVKLGSYAAKIAEAEGLVWHQQSLTQRLIKP